MNSRKIHYAILFIYTLLSLLFIQAHAGKLYKWVDEEGNVFFSDQIPPSDIKHKHSTFTDSGFEVESVEKQKSREQLLKEKQLAEEQKRIAEEKKREEDRIKAKKLAYDRQLLDSYVTEDDLIMMRDRQIATIEGTITLTQSNIDKLKLQLDKLSSKAKNLDPENERDQKALKELRSTRDQLEEYQEFIDRQRLEQIQLRTQFNQDLKRLRQLLSAKK